MAAARRSPTGERLLPEPFSPEQLRQLRQRWERDPKSRAFLQLAEEYRRAGSLPEAIHVLRAGLAEHPNYLSAQVALGRSLVESNEPGEAITILERAVARDPTQLVASKLLVEAYLSRGEASKARERLELYKLFNDRDEEIEPLDNRIRALENPSAPANAGRSRAALEVRPEALFELPAIVSLPELNLGSLAPPLPSPAASPTAEPFGRLFPAGAIRSIESAFVEQGIFPLAPVVERSWWQAAEESTPEAIVAAALPIDLDESPAVEIGEATAAPRDWEAASWPEGGAALTEVAEPAVAPAVLQPPTAPWFAAEPARGVAVDEAASTVSAEPPVVDPGPIFEAPALASLVSVVPSALRLGPAEAAETAVPAAPAAPAKTASTTLGELYLAQGHLAEAEESFRAVLQARPGDLAALAGLETVRQQRGDDRFAFAGEAGISEESNAVVGGLAARKAELLKAYLARLRRGAKRHVS